MGPDVIRLVGAVTVCSETVAERPVDVGPLGKTAFGCLVLERSRTVPRDELADALWGVGLPSTWQASLRGVLARLRGELDRRSEHGLSIVASGASTYRLICSNGTRVDVEEAAQATAVAESCLDHHEPEHAQTSAQRAIRLLDGQLLPGTQGEWVDHRRGQIDDLRVRSLEALADAASRCRVHAVALRAARSAVELAPLRESSHRLVMRAHALAGNRGEALQAYHQCRQVMAAEMGVEPGPATHEVYLRLLADEDGRDDLVPPGAASRLPVRADSLVGRDHAIRDVRQALDDHRVVTITGLPGVGKSRVGAEVARTIAASDPDAVRLVNLAEVAVTDDLPQSVRTAVTGSTGVTVADATSAPGLRRRMLLVLDDCDPHIRAMRGPLGELLEEIAGLQILATSCQPLGVAQEHIHQLAPMAVPNLPVSEAPDELLHYDAVQLFLDRARAINDDLEFDASALAELCERLDGLPLAIEIAASAIRTYSIAEMLRWTAIPSRLLTYAGPSSTFRHRTLQRTLDWSHATLGHNEQVLLAQLSVFDDGFCLPALESVSVGPATNVHTTLRHLVEASWVRVVRHGDGYRYRLSHLVRADASQRLDRSGRTAAVRDAHAAWVGRLTRHASILMDGPHEPEALAQLNDEWGNVRAALEWLADSGWTTTALRVALSVWRFWELAGHCEHGRQVLEDLARSPLTPPRLKARGLNAAAILAHRQSHNREARRLYVESLAIWAAVDDSAGEAIARNGLAHLDISEGHYATARRGFRRNLATAEQLGDGTLAAATLMNLGVVEQLRCTDGGSASSRERARMLLTEARARFEGLGNRREAARCLANLGSLALFEGHAPAGRARLEHSQRTLRLHGDNSSVAENLRLLGEHGLPDPGSDSETTLAYLEECLTLWRDMGNSRQAAEIMVSLSRARAANNDPVQAQQYLRQSLLLFCELADGPSARAVLEQLEASLTS